MSEDGSRGFDTWEMEVATKVVRAFKRKSRSLQHDDVEDLLQECLLHWFQVRGRATPGPEGPPRAYMGRVLRN